MGLLLRLIRTLVCALPEGWVRGLGRALGLLAWHVIRVRRGVTLENLQVSLGLGEAEARRLGREVYIHLCTGALEMLRVSLLNADRARALLGAAGLAKLQALLASGRGLLVLSGHLGHWDLLACAAARCGLPLNVVTRSIKSRPVNRFWMAEREACGIRLLPAEGSARAIINALHRGEVVAMVMDQHSPGGEVVSFFGRAASTSTALARLARATGTPVVPAFLLRRGDHFELQVEEPLQLVWSGDRRSDVQRATQDITRVLEQAVACDPAQWLWLHRRWKAEAAGPGHATRLPAVANSPAPRDTAQQRGV